MNEPTRRRRPTLEDVARQAGVNRVTAAVALKRSPRAGTRVSPATRQRVVQAAQELGYIPNAIAQALRGQRTNIIGYYTGYESLDAQGLFSAALLTGLQRSCRAHHCDLLLFGSFRRNSINDLYAALTDGRIDGLIFLPTPLSPATDQLQHTHLPVVAVANPVAGIPSVGVDDEGGAELQAHFLAERGHERILYRADPHTHSSTVRRQRAFLVAAQRHGMAVTVTVSHGAGDTLSAEEVALLTRSRQERPTAAVVWEDAHGYAFLECCRELGLSIPQDLAVIGFNGILPPVRPAQLLTSVAAPWEEVAAQAVQLLLTLIGGGQAPHETILPVDGLIGDTA